MSESKEQVLWNVDGKNTPLNKQQNMAKRMEQTATKLSLVYPNENQSIRIRNQLFGLYHHKNLKGKIKVQNVDNLTQIDIVFYHMVNNQNVNQTVRVTFGDQYPEKPPKFDIVACNLTQQHPEYHIPKFLTQIQLLSTERWNSNTDLSDALGKVMETIETFHTSEIQRLHLVKEQEQQEHDSCESVEAEMMKDEGNFPKVIKHRRKSSNMTGCADKELTETKNLNRHFRSKLREVLRDMSSAIQGQNEDYNVIDQIFTPNRVGFEDIRRALSNRWFNVGVRRQMNSGQFLHKILRGMMGIKSKKLMIKYYHVMVTAAQEPNSFTRWKYD